MSPNASTHDLLVISLVPPSGAPHQSVPPSTFAQRLQHRMHQLGITQVQLADSVGVTQGAVSGWINGAVPRSDKATRIAKALGVSLSTLLADA